jgi:hypothetical protein
MKLALCITLIISMVGVSGCGSPQPDVPQSEATDTESPPSTKDVLRFLLRHSDVPLTVDNSCSAVGTSSADRTIGDYLSGFWAEHADQDGQNWLEITTMPAAMRNGEGAWECRLMIRRRDSEQEIGWGVSFLVRRANRVLVRDSFRCLGGG